MFRTDMGMKKQGVVAYALSALDIGLWDIAGKAAGLRVYKLWGAVTDRIRAYGSGGWSKYSERELIAEAEKYAAQGCRHYKMKIHHPDPRENRKRVEAVRRALGEGVRMMVDVNQRLDVLANIRQARSLEDFDLVWYEEPVLADDIAACAEVAHAIRIPVATGANHYTRVASHRQARRRPPGRARAGRRARALAARGRRALERLPGGVHRLDPARSVRGDAGVQGRPFPDPRSPRARHGARPRGEGKISKRLESPAQREAMNRARSLTALRSDAAK